MPDKAKANFCEFFEFSRWRAAPRHGRRRLRQDRARANFNSLFSKKR